MSKRLSNVWLLMAVTVAAGCEIERTPRVAADDPANVARDEIELTLRNFQAALIEADARRAAGFFTTDAHLYLPDSPTISGRGAIDHAFAERFEDERPIDVAMDLERTDVAAGVAHQFGTLLERVRDADDGERTLHGRVAIRWVRTADSEWRINRLMMNYAPVDSAEAGGG